MSRSYKVTAKPYIQLSKARILL